MKKKDWNGLVNEIKGTFPHLLQIAQYSGERWIWVFDLEPDNYLHTFATLPKLLKKYHLPAPLILSKDFITTSLDSYPLEFLDMQSSYVNLLKPVPEDCLQPLKFSKTDIRLQMERELKSKWLLTRVFALQHLNDCRKMFYLLKESLIAILPVCKGFLYLKDRPIPKADDKLLEQTGEVTLADVKVLKHLLQTPKPPSANLCGNIFNDYIRFVRYCMDTIDTWTV